MVQLLADKFSLLEGRVVSTGEVFDKISTRMVSFEMVKDIFTDLTSEGGRFYDMQAKQAETLYGKLSNLTDAFQIMLNQIGTSSQDVLKGSLDGLISLMNNWENVAKYIGIAVAAYGTYKGILLATVAIQKVHVAYLSAERFLAATSALRRTTQAMIALNSVMSVNPWIALATGIAAVSTAFILFSEKIKSTEQLIQDTNKSIESYSKTVQDNAKSFNKFIEAKQNVALLKQEIEDLSSKTNLTGEESAKLKTKQDQLVTSQQKLQNVMNNLVDKTLPAAATAFDEYGNVIDIQIDKYLKYTEKEKEAEENGLKAQISINEKRLKNLKEQLKKEVEVLSTGKRLKNEIVGGGGTAGMVTTVSYKLNEQDILKTKEGISLLRIGIEDLEKDTNSAKNSLKGLFDVADDIVKPIEGWRKLAMEAGKGLFTEKELNDIQGYGEFVKIVIDENIQLAKSIKEIKDIPKPTEDLIKTLNELNDRYEKNNAVISRFNIQVKDKGSEDAAKSRINILKDEADLIKKIYSDYLKLKETMSEAEAQKTITELYKNIVPKDITIPFKVEDIKKELQNKADELDKFKEKEAQKKGLEVKLDIIGYDADEYKKILDKLIKQTESELSKYKSKYDFFKQILGITGDEQVAIQIAFGGEGGFGEGIVNQIKKSFEQIAGMSFDFAMTMDMDAFDELPEKVKDAFQKAKDDIQAMDFNKIIDMQKMVADYVSASEKITMIGKKRDSDIEAARQTTERQLEKDANGEVIIESEKNKKLLLLLDSYVSSRTQSAEKEIDDVQRIAFESTEIYAKLFGDMTNKSVSSLKEIANAGAKLLKPENIKERRDKEGKVTGMILIDPSTSKEIEISLELFNRLTKSISKLQADVRAYNPIEQLLRPKGENPADKWAEQAVALGKLSNISEQVGGDLVTVFEGLGFSENISETISDITKTLAGLGKTAQAVAQVMSGDIIGGTVGIVGGIAETIGGIFSATKRSNERIIKDSEAQIKRLENAYNDLQRATERAAGTDYFKKQEEQIKNLQAQQAELQKQLRTEGKKGGLSKEEAEEVRRQIVELGQQQEDIIDNTRDNLLGSFKDIAQELGDALFEAFKNGENYAEAWGNKVNDIVGEILKNMLIQKWLQKPIEEALSKFEAKFIDKKTGGVDLDKMLKNVGSFADELNGIGETYGKIVTSIFEDPAFEQYFKLAEGQKGKGTAQAIQGVTEDTANILGGYMNGIRAEVVIQTGIFNNIYALLQERLGAGGTNPIAQAQLNVMNQQLQELQAIKTILNNTLGEAWDAANRRLRV